MRFEGWVDSMRKDGRVGLARPNLLIRLGQAYDAFRGRREPSPTGLGHKPSPPARFPSKWAILVGVDEYEHVAANLKFSKSDIVAIGTAFRNDLGFSDDHILEFHKDSKLKPTRSNILHKLGELKNGRSVGEDDLLIFYFSGHGMISPADKHDYLLPSAASLYVLDETALRVTQVIEHLKGTGCKNVVMFIDACRELTLGGRGVHSIGVESGQAAGQAGIVTFFSCYPEDFSYEIEDLEHGSFTYCVLDAIKDASCNTVIDLEKYLRQKVPTINAKYKKPAQQPYAVIEPATMAELEILFSQSQRRETEEQLEALERKLGDLAAGGQLDYKYLSKAVRVLERTRTKQMISGDSDKLDLIGSVLESDEYDKRSFQILWDAVEKIPSTTPRIEAMLEPLR